MLETGRLTIFRAAEDKGSPQKLTLVNVFQPC